ncbi:MAG TPA: long-chain-fatty-acid--CoA ligase [Ilumatobacter sp.]|nr:long-chain-fatty-acid--CoA ligase [Ilumatobacter sp.]
MSTVVDILRAQADSEAVALVFEERLITYRELDTRSSRLAQVMRAAGVEPDDRIAFLDKNRPEYFEVLFGAAKLGAACVCVNWRLAPREVAHVVTDSAATLLFVGADLAALVEQIEAELPGTRVIALDHHERWPAYEAWLDGGIAEDPAVQATPDHIALQLYTSGTTGAPKGAMLSNRNFFAMANATAPVWGFRPGMCSIGVSPLFHIAGTGWNLMVLAFGGTVVLQREVDGEAILRDIERFRVTHAILVPAILQLILARRNEGVSDPSSLETVVYGASPISSRVLLELFEAFDCKFMQAYGLTETSGAVTTLRAEDHDPSRPELLRSCGQPLTGVELRIVDSESGNDCADTEVGEVWIRSDQVMTGYWRNPEATAEAIDADGWFRSGDAGFLVDGRLYLHDRVKDMIVSGAENVYPAEVENVLMDHLGVAEVAVIGVPHDRWGETVKAIVVRNAGAKVTEAELITHARANLAHYKCPTSVEFVVELPRNATGKILKRDLREPYWKDRDRRIG